MNEMDDQRLFDLLDRYVSALHSGDGRQCDRLLDEYPELREMAQCLEALGRFSVSAPDVSNSALGPATFPSGKPPASEDPPELEETVIRMAGSLDATSDSEALALGEFGKYELLEEVGRGGMGVVFRARQRDLNRIVALKMILSNRLAGGEDVKRFYREARAAGSLRHPQIVGIHEVGQIHGQHYFAMDFIPGTSLAGRTGSQSLNPDQAARCLAGVARAVQYLHDHGIVHRDLKPSNILLDAAGTAFVTDFGLAKVFGDQEDRTQTGVILGTPGYMSPEQAAGRISQISARSDVYSLGAILYELLTGRPPFREDNPLNTILQVLESEPTLPHQLNSQIPPELERICLKCLEKDPARRYASANALADDLDRYLLREPIEAKPAGLVDRFLRWVRRETGLAARLAIMAVATTIVEVQHILSHRPWTYHIEIKLTFAAWAALAFIFQWLLRREKTAELARLAWAVTDPVLLMVVLLLADDIGPILVGYPVLVTASGLWLSGRLVLVSTVGCILSYAVLLVMRHEPTNQPHYPFIFVTALAVIGAIVAYGVHRVRTLSRYFEQTRPPQS
jgi:serine/threonine-protein kinase